MRYLFAIYLDEPVTARRSAAEIQSDMASHAPYIEMLKRKQLFVSSDPLWPSQAARTLTGVSGKVVATDGPFAESREQFGGYYVVSAEDLDQAMHLAAVCPALTTPGVAGLEIRPFLCASDAQGKGPAVPTENADSRFLWAVYQPASLHASLDEEDQVAAAFWNHYVERWKASTDVLETALLAPSGSATTLSTCGGTTAVMDGPFANGARELRGFLIVRAHDMDQAVKRATAAVRDDDAIEVRPIRDVDGMQAR